MVLEVSVCTEDCRFEDAVRPLMCPWFCIFVWIRDEKTATI